LHRFLLKCTSTIKGALLVGDFEVALDIFRYCQSLVEYVHDSLDLMVVHPLIFLACGTMYFYEFGRARDVALTYLYVAESTLQILGHIQEASEVQ
jgi:hypothetical protein